MKVFASLAVDYNNSACLLGLYYARHFSKDYQDFSLITHTILTSIYVQIRKLRHRSLTISFATEMRIVMSVLLCSNQKGMHQHMHHPNSWKGGVRTGAHLLAYGQQFSEYGLPVLDLLKQHVIGRDPSSLCNTGDGDGWNHRFIHQSIRTQSLAQNNHTSF